MNERAALRILTRHPEIARDSIYTAVVCGDLESVKRLLAERPEAATESGGARGWTPLLYLCYGRLPLPEVSDNAVGIARALLDRSADPNAYYMAGDARYSALVGVAGEGEQDATRHSRAEALYQLLLERGAGPYDIQVLYNTHFRGDVLWWLELTYTQAVKSGRKADWDDPDWPMLDMGGYGSGARFLFRIALQRSDLGLAEWLLSHGANPNAGPARDARLSKRSVYEEALRQGFTEMAELLARYGATRTPLLLDEQEAFASACFRLDRDEVHAVLERHPEYLQSPYAIFAAAKRDRADVVAFLLDLGVSIEIEDVQKQRPLHKAAANDATRVAELLIARGAEIDPREANWGATPIGYATHSQKTTMIDLLSRFSRDVWSLASNGKVDRLREVLNAEPELAKVVSKNGMTPLWWLPDDETRAVEIVDLFLAHGADPSMITKEGTTAADYARKRGLDEAARRLAGGRGDAAIVPPELQRFERLAKDIVIAHESGDPATMQRVQEYFGRSFTWEELRRRLQQHLTMLSGSDRGTSYIDLADAHLIIARGAGFSDWAEFASAHLGRASSKPPYAIDSHESKIRPRRMLVASEWDNVIGVMKEQRISGLDANGHMTDDVLERIAALDHVTYLNLDGSAQLTDAGLAHLARLPRLQELNISGWKGRITDGGLEVLRRLPELRRFQMCWQQNVSDAGTANLKFCEHLESVDLMGTQTGDGAIAALSGKGKLHRFKTGRNVTDAGFVLLHRFPVFAAWQGGDMRYGLMSADAGPTHLMVDGPFTDAGIASLAGLEGLFALSFFRHSSAFTGAGLAPLKDLPNVGFVGCEGERCNDEAMRHIAAVPRLRMLMAQGTVASDKGFMSLSRSRTLEYIWGRECPNLTGRSFAALSAMQSLRGLAVSCKNVDDEALSTLRSFPALREFMPMDMQDDGFRHVGSCENLEALWCMYCRDTTDAATEHIAGLSRLKTYYAGKTRITDRSLEILGGMTSLESLTFWQCAGLTDAGLALLARLPRLREVHFEGGMPHVTLEGTAVFAAHVRVDHSV
jgi:ankyrin repeat protein